MVAFYILLLINILAAQALLCAVIHISRPSRVPSGVLDTIRMLFLPWVLLNLDNLD